MSRQDRELFDALHRGFLPYTAADAVADVRAAGRFAFDLIAFFALLLGGGGFLFFAL